MIFTIYPCPVSFCPSVSFCPHIILPLITLVQKSYCYTPGVGVSVRVGVGVHVGVHIQNVRVNVKVLKLKSFFVSLCIISWPNILIYSKTIFYPLICPLGSDFCALTEC